MTMWPLVNVLMSGLLLLVVMPVAPAGQPEIYWGAMIKGSAYGFADAPWDFRSVEQFEQNAGKQVSIIHWGQPWWHCYSQCGYQYFASQRAQYDKVREHGAIPLVDWGSWDYAASNVVEQPRFSLRTIIHGEHDNYIRGWATQARDWGHPFFLRFNWEMNGNWFPWSEEVNGNQAGEFVLAWRHVHAIFEDVGADNVTWVWCPTTLHGGAIPLERLYPGDAYVDWTCMDGYNWGTHPEAPDRWRSFYTLFAPTYRRLLLLAPEKPIMIGEMASTEVGGSKVEWIEQALTHDLPYRFPAIRAVLWFNWEHNGMDWVIESSPEAQAAFAAAIASDYFASNRFANLGGGPVEALADVDPIHPACRREMSSRSLKGGERE